MDAIMPGGALVTPTEPPEQVTTVQRRCAGSGRGVVLEGHFSVSFADFFIA